MLVQRDYANLLPKLVDALFQSPEDRRKAQEILAEYSGPAHERVLVGVLKASNGHFDKMRSLVGLANRDYRDLLVEAEFSESFDNDHLRISDPEQYRKIQQHEAKKYDEWIAKTLGT